MRFIIVTLILLVVLLYSAPWISRILPPQYNPFSPLLISDPPNFITQFKLRRLDKNPQACFAALERARDAGAISFITIGDTGGTCPLSSPVRVQRFGSVALSSSFLASCRLALSSAMFISQVVKPQAQAQLGSDLIRIDHLGSYVCRNLYNRAEGKLSEHATAEALDVAGFHLADGTDVTVLKGWKEQKPRGSYIRAIFKESCSYFGNSIGPDYNVAHANHFHFGMRWFGFCR
ncbi:extensin family protein [Ewingella sp. S1.OA.A_B6]